MVNEVRGNFKSKYVRNGGEAALLCDNCDQRQVETQSHCLICPKWEGIRQGLDVTTIEGLTTFNGYYWRDRKRRLAHKEPPSKIPVPSW